MEPNDQVTIDQLLEVTRLQGENIDRVVAATAVIADEVEKRPTKRSAFGVSLIIGLVTLLIVGFLAYKSLDAAETNQNLLQTINGCLTPGEECYELAQQQRTENRLAINCEQEILITYVIIASGGFESQPPYPYIPECIPRIEEALQIDIPEATTP